eukprot:SAG31_NODE_36886_length_309_cov_0.966667_1_plen_31_part_10
MPSAVPVYELIRSLQKEVAAARVSEEAARLR